MTHSADLPQARLSRHSTSDEVLEDKKSNRPLASIFCSYIALKTIFSGERTSHLEAVSNLSPGRAPSRPTTSASRRKHCNTDPYSLPPRRRPTSPRYPRTLVSPTTKGLGRPLHFHKHEAYTIRTMQAGAKVPHRGRATRSSASLSISPSTRCTTNKTACGVLTKIHSFMP